MSAILELFYPPASKSKINNKYKWFHFFVVNVFSVLTLLGACLLLGLADHQPMYEPVLTWIQNGTLVVSKGLSVSSNIFIICYIILAFLVNNLFLYLKINTNGKNLLELVWLLFYFVDAVKYGFFAILLATSSGVTSPIQLSNMIIVTTFCYFFILVRAELYKKGKK